MIPERRMFMNNDDKLKEQMKSAPVPDKLRPENIKIMLDNEKANKKRSGITMAGRITAAAAAFAVIGGTAAYTMSNGKLNKKIDDKGVISQDTGSASTTAPASADKGKKKTDNTSSTDKEEKKTGSKKRASYMNSAADYDEVYTLFDKAAKKARHHSRNYKYGAIETAITDEEAVYENDYKESPAAVDNGLTGEAGIGGGGEELHETPVVSPKTEGGEQEEPVKEDDPDHSETYYQEQDVLEADIVKTDGKHIYYLTAEVGEDYSSAPVLRTADVKDGKFTASTTIDICSSAGIEDNGYNVSAVDMYIYNDMIAIIGNNNNSNFYSGMDYRDYESGKPYTFIAFYTAGDDPQLIDVYKQDGYYSDVRISPEGYLLLSSSYTTSYFDNINGSSDTRNYIPYCGFAESYDILPAEDILLPIDGFGSTDYLSYTVLGSLDLNNSGSPAVRDKKTLAGYTGSIYCSADNLYTAACGDELSVTDITRISIKDGNIVPEAGTSINGDVKDQFSMSEYGGYFRVAATYTATNKTYHAYSNEDKNLMKELWDYLTEDEQNGYYSYERVKTDTRVYVFDMDMDMVGSIDGLGVDEQLRSASFSGNMAYVVTFRQTDPLYAVDLSDPANPVLLDELKINGFSTYMQQWDDGLLIGFGQEADDDGMITGIKLTLFDNSDPNNLKVSDVYTWSVPQNDDDYWSDLSGKSYEYYSSIAVWERKALLIAPGKNIIGIPVNHSKVTYGERENEYGGLSSDSVETYQYVFFGVENGRLVRKGDISEVHDGWDNYGIRSFNRAIYIGDYVYTLSSKKFVAADINTLAVTDELKF